MLLCHFQSGGNKEWVWQQGIGDIYNTLVVNIISCSLFLTLTQPCSTISIGIFFLFFPLSSDNLPIISIPFQLWDQKTSLLWLHFSFSRGLAACTEIGWCVSVVGFVFLRLHKWQVSLYVHVLMCVKYSPLLQVSTTENEALCVPQGTLRFWEYSQVSRRTYPGELETGIGRDERRAVTSFRIQTALFSFHVGPVFFFLYYGIHAIQELYKISCACPSSYCE